MVKPIDITLSISPSTFYLHLHQQLHHFLLYAHSIKQKYNLILFTLLRILEVFLHDTETSFSGNLMREYTKLYFCLNWLQSLYSSYFLPRTAINQELLRYHRFQVCIYHNNNSSKSNRNNRNSNRSRDSRSKMRTKIRLMMKQQYTNPSFFIGNSQFLLQY